jgi:hypothetical protein
MHEVIKQHQWRKSELIERGFAYYQRKKQLVLAARLPESVAPMEIHYPMETVIAESGDVICFDPGSETRPTLLDYDHWSVKMSIFLQTYRDWDESLNPTTSEAHLLECGCKPYYKSIGVWARRLQAPTWIQSLESPQPMLIPEGMWLAVGPEGEPWHIEDEKFRQRYIIES